MRNTFITLADTPGVIAATTCRGPGADAAQPYSGFSLCHYTGDTATHVAECRMQLCAWLGTDDERLVVPRQTHSTNVAIVTEENAGLTMPCDTDAIVTRLTGMVVGVNTADCVPVLLYDEGAGVVGATHAGWRGAVGGILGNTIEAMVKEGADAASIHAIVCPCICVDCFEVGEEVAEQFPAECVSRGYGVKPHVDLPRYAAQCLAKAGVRYENILHTGECTRCNPVKYFSARAAGIASGRNFSFIALRDITLNGNGSLIFSEEHA